MGGDVASLAAEMTPYVSAAAATYGGAVLVRVRDDAADATVGLGRRLLQRVFGTRGEAEPLPGPLGDLAADPQDGDALAAVRLLVRKCCRTFRMSVVASLPVSVCIMRMPRPAEPGGAWCSGCRAGA